MNKIAKLFNKFTNIPLIFRSFILLVSVFGLCFSSSFIFSNPFQSSVCTINKLIDKTTGKFAETRIYSNEFDNDVLDAFYYEYLNITSIQDTSNIRKYNQGRISKVILSNEIVSAESNGKMLLDTYVVSTPKNYSIRNDEFYFHCDALTKYKFYTYNNQANSCAISKDLAFELIVSDDYDSLIGQSLSITTTSGIYTFSIQCVFEGTDSYCGEKSIVIKDSDSTNSIFSNTPFTIFLDLVKAEKCISVYLSFILDNDYRSSTLIIENGTSNVEYSSFDIYNSYCSAKRNGWIWTLHIILFLLSLIIFLAYSFLYGLFVNNKTGTFVFILFLVLVACFVFSFLPINSYLIQMDSCLLFSYTSIPILILVIMLLAFGIISNLRKRSRKI